MSIVNVIEDLINPFDEKPHDLFRRQVTEKLTLIFTTRENLDKNPVLRNELFAQYSIPEYIWTDVCKRLQGYFGSEDIFCEDESAIISHVTWFHFEIKYPFPPKKKEDVEYQSPTPQDGKKSAGYVWYKIGVVTCWRAPDQHTIIFFDAENSPAVGIRNELKFNCENIKVEPSLRNPYWAHQFLIGPILACYDQAVWNLRDQVKALEQVLNYITIVQFLYNYLWEGFNRLIGQTRREGKPMLTNSLESNDRDLNESSITFNALHEILRHALHKTEILGVAIQTLSSICDRKRVFDEERYSTEMSAKRETALSMAITRRCAKKIMVYLDFQLSIVKSLEARARANEARIRSEITLAFSTVAQLDSRVQAEIGHAARADSYTMVKIAAVTMLFLPPSFVSAIFSTSFFKFDPPEDQKISKDFWVFWAISIPLTIIVFVGLYPGNRGLSVRKHISSAAHHKTTAVAPVVSSSGVPPGNMV